MRIVAGILIGGQSRRMGRPKALINWHGETLIERTCQVAGSAADVVVLSGSPTFALPQSLKPYKLIADDPPGIGPLGGLAALSNAFPDEAILLLACDMPELSPEILQLLTGNTEFDAVATSSKQIDAVAMWEPCCALYMPACRPAIRAAIECRSHSLQTLLSNVRTLNIGLSQEQQRLVRNVNTEEDLASLRPPIPPQS